MGQPGSSGTQREPDSEHRASLWRWGGLLSRKAGRLDVLLQSGSGSVVLAAAMPAYDVSLPSVLPGVAAAQVSGGRREP